MDQSILIIVIEDLGSSPVMALYAKVVVGFGGQTAASGTAFQQSLCQGDAGRYLVFLLLFHGHILVFVDIGPVGTVGAAL